MRQRIIEKISLFATNMQDLEGGFKPHVPMGKRLAAILYAIENKPMDCDAIKRCHTLIKDSKGSTFKGNMPLCVSAMLSLQEAPHQRIADTLTIYDLLKTAKFRASDCLAVGACLIACHTDPQNHQSAIERAKAFYEEMKKHRRSLIGPNDYIFAVMFGLSDIDPISGAERIEHLYQCLKPEFKARAGGNAVQRLAQILALGGKTDEALNHIFALRDVFRSHRIKLDKMYTLPALGILALLPIDGNILAIDILEAQACLREQKGFSSFSTTSQGFLRYSAVVVASVYAEGIKNDITTSIPNIIMVMILAGIMDEADDSVSAALAMMAISPS